ncbi:MAG: hypothetical protein ACRDP5_27635, partial [Streptosporangiaceae bacterium]
KKVRYMIGAAGALALAPALGALTPAANAATTQGAAGHSGKTVSLNHRTTATAQPSLSSPCYLHVTNPAITGKGPNMLSGFALHGGRGVNSCVYGTKAVLWHSQTGLRMRTRLYRNGKQIHQGFVKGTINQVVGQTSFQSTHLNIDAPQACEALVYSTQLSKVAFGPVCENI